MQHTPSPLVQIILRYDAPLQRYARRLVKDQAVAAAIVKEVFERVYELNQFNVNDKTLRRLFKECTNSMAQNWLLHGESRQRTIDDRPQGNSQPRYQHHKKYYLLNRLKSRALSLLMTQFAKKPKNPT